ncbi:MAG: hypothetical protein LBH41_00495 [Rickettsiales bacterium]|jgi:hypothetical protein|nr:hypothetical protein [Rickettsiales bacterium]
MKRLLALLLILFPRVAAARGCDMPGLYGLTALEAAGKDAPCWEIRWARDYGGDLDSIGEAYGPDPFVPVGLLRENAITPEKAAYLDKYFVDRDAAGNVKRGFFTSDRSLLREAVRRAQEEMRDRKVEYKINLANIVSLKSPLAPENTKFQAWSSYFKIFQNNCMALPFENLVPKAEKFVRIFDVMHLREGISELIGHGAAFQKAFDAYPEALRPVGVVGSALVNAFGEMVGDIGVESAFGMSDTSLRTPPIRVRGGSPIKVLGMGVNWSGTMCPLGDPSSWAKRPLACLPCYAFEIAFNAVSRIGFVMWDSLSRYALGVMVAGFLIWSLFLFFGSVVRDGEPFGFVKGFFQQIAWVCVIAAALSVSIKDEDNFLNYTLRPLVSLMDSFGEAITMGVDGRAFKCRYAGLKNIDSNKVLFDGEVKRGIVCSIERMADFNNMNFTIGRYAAAQGWRRFVNFDWDFGWAGIAGYVLLLGLIFLAVYKKSLVAAVVLISVGLVMAPLVLAPGFLLGVLVMCLFFYMNLAVPFYFIESVFAMALVLLLSPFWLAGYPFKRSQNMLGKALRTFLGAVFQIISLGIGCAAIALLVSISSGMDLGAYMNAMQSGDKQAVAVQIISMLSFDSNDLLQMVYVWMLCWHLMSGLMRLVQQAFPAEGYSGIFGGSMAQSFVSWARNSVKYAASVGRDRIFLKNSAKIAAAKALEREGV